MPAAAACGQPKQTVQALLCHAKRVRRQLQAKMQLQRLRAVQVTRCERCPDLEHPYGNRAWRTTTAIAWIAGGSIRWICSDGHSFAGLPQTHRTTAAQCSGASCWGRAAVWMHTMRLTAATRPSVATPGVMQLTVAQQGRWMHGACRSAWLLPDPARSGCSTAASLTHLARAQTGCQSGGVPAVCALGQRRTPSPGCQGSSASLREAGGPPPALSPADGCLCVLHPH